MTRGGPARQGFSFFLACPTSFFLAVPSPCQRVRVGGDDVRPMAEPGAVRGSGGGTAAASGDGLASVVVAAPHN
jgi:hypothetical protein